jgi:hypothetical protein
LKHQTEHSQAGFLATHLFHPQVLDLLEDYMRWKGFPVERIDGRIRGAMRQVRLYAVSDLPARSLISCLPTFLHPRPTLPLQVLLSLIPFPTPSPSPSPSPSRSCPFDSLRLAAHLARCTGKALAYSNWAVFRRKKPFRKGAALNQQLRLRLRLSHCLAMRWTLSHR